MTRAYNAGMSLIRLLAILAVIGAGLYLARDWLRPSAPAPAAGAPGITYLGERDDDPVLVRWDGRKGSVAGPAPSLALRLRHTDRYAWWFRDGPRRLASADPKGPEELHLSIAVPSADSFPAAMFDPICAPGENPFALCRDGLARVIVHRPEFHTKAESILMGTEAPPVNESLPFEQRATHALMEFWTHTDSATGRERIAGWACPDGLRIELNTPAPLAVLAAGAAPDPRLACFAPPEWWQRMAPERFGYLRHPVYFQCEPKAPCEADFFYQARNVELMEEHAREKPAPWHTLALFVASWETLERMRADAAQPPDTAPEFAEARVLMQVCDALVAEGRRWVQHNSLADDPASGSRPFTAWQSRSLPCRQAASIVTRLVALEPAKAEPLLVKVIAAFESLGAHESEPLYEVWLTALEKAGKTDSAHMLDAYVGALPTLASYGEYDKDLPRKQRRLEQAWQLARTLDPPAGLDQAGKIAQALAGFKRSQKDEPGALEVYRQWNEWVTGRGATAIEQLDSRESLASALWGSGDWAAFRGAIDDLRNAYLAASADGLPADELRERVARAAFYAVFYYRCYAFHENAFGIGADATPVLARMEFDFGADSKWYKAARFHLDEVSTRRPASNGTPIGGGFLGY